MNFEQLINNITPDIYQALKRAVEIGKWPNGSMLTPEQKSLVMEAVISYEHLHVDEEERMGFIDRGSKKQDETCGSDIVNSEQETAIKWS